MKEVQATWEKSLQPSKENIQHCKPRKFPNFFLYLGPFFPLLDAGPTRPKSMRIRTKNIAPNQVPHPFMKENMQCRLKLLTVPPPSLNQDSSKCAHKTQINCSVADPDPGSGIRCLFDPWIRDPGWVKNQESGFGIQIRDEQPGSFPRASKPIFG